MLTRQKHLFLKEECYSQQPKVKVLPSDETLLACREEERKKPKSKEKKFKDNFPIKKQLIPKSVLFLPQECLKQFEKDATSSFIFFPDKDLTDLRFEQGRFSPGTNSESHCSNTFGFVSPVFSRGYHIEKGYPVHKKKRTKSKNCKVTLIASAQKKPWTDREDRVLAEAIEKLGAQSWSRIAKCLPGRIGKQCRERWHNHLSPTVKKGNWTQEEDEIIFQQHKVVGNQWALIARHVRGRTDNAVKNRYYSTMRKLKRQKAKSQKTQIQDQKRLKRTESRNLRIETNLPTSLYNEPASCYNVPINWDQPVQLSPSGLSLPPGFQPIPSTDSSHSLCCGE